MAVYRQSHYSAIILLYGAELILLFQHL